MFIFTSISKSLNLSGVDGHSCNRVTYTDQSLCATLGSSVVISCSYKSYDDNVQSKSWFTSDRDFYEDPTYKDMDEDEDEDFFDESVTGYSTLTITSLTYRDSAEYHFKFKTASFEWKSVLPGTRLQVTGTDAHKLI